MKKKLNMAAMLFAGALMLGACGGNNQNQNSNGEGTSEDKLDPVSVSEVQGRKNFATADAVVTPQPAFMIATYDVNNVPNMMMAAWGCQCSGRHICFYLSEHKTTENLTLKRAFTVSFATKNDIVESDYFGIVSGKEVIDKVAKAGFTATKSPNVDAPIINEYPLTLECRVVEMHETNLNSIYVRGEIVNMSAADSILDENGKVDIDKLQMVVYSSADRSYRLVGEKVGEAWGSGRALINAE